MSAIDLGFRGVWVSGKGSGLLALWLELGTASYSVGSFATVYVSYKVLGTRDFLDP